MKVYHLLFCLALLLPVSAQIAPEATDSVVIPHAADSEKPETIVALDRLLKVISENQDAIEALRTQITGPSQEEKQSKKQKLTAELEAAKQVKDSLGPDADDSALSDNDHRIALLEAQLQDIEKTLTEEQKNDLNAEILLLKEKQSEYELQFEELATGVRRNDIEEQQVDPLTLEEQFRQVLSPLLEEVRDATADSREIDSLYTEASTLEKRRAIAVSAIKNIDSLLGESSADESLRNQLEEARLSWAQISDEAESALSATRLQIEKRESEKKSAVSVASNFFKNFFKSRGWNVLLSILIFFLVYIILKRLTPFVYKLSPVHKKGERTFFSRIVSLLYVAFTLLVATIAALITLYIARDWVLLSLLLLILLGVFWGARQAIPPMMEQIRLILNIGPVRENERIIYEGIPWKVSHLGLYSRLTNPELAGGLMRLPARTLLDFHSRPYDTDEIWFPTSKHDWVILSDDTYGKVLLQTPEYVQILQLGGARTTYPVSEYLSLAPQNLSKNFRVKSVFGIDYDHQAICTTEAPEIFQKRLSEDLSKLFGEDVFTSVSVNFASAAASSLDYEILADFKGDAADKYQKIRRAIQSICVDVCNEQNWGIPFQQITIHQAGS